MLNAITISVIVLSVSMQSIIVLTVVMLSVIMLCAILLNVVIPNVCTVVELSPRHSKVEGSSPACIGRENDITILM